MRTGLREAHTSPHNKPESTERAGDRALRRAQFPTSAGALARPPTPRRLEGRHRNRGRLDRRLAERADLPQRLERLLAVAARLLELRRADRADEERRIDL